MFATLFTKFAVIKNTVSNGGNSAKRYPSVRNAGTGLSVTKLLRCQNF